VSAEEQCGELLQLADEYKLAGVIDGEDWRDLMEEANAFCAYAVKD
jgi:hypothetical protein